MTEEAEKYTRQANKYAEEKDLRRSRMYTDWANDAMSKARLRLSWAQEARDKARLRMKWAEDAMKKK